MKTIKSKKLKKDMTIGLLSVSGAIDNVNEIDIAKSRLEKTGFKVKVSQYNNHRYLAGTKEECLNRLHSFFSDKSIDMILAIRGGYGTLKFINDIDFNLIKNNPKIFVGFSDITNLLVTFYKKAGLICFHGPMVLSDFSSVFNKKSYYNMLDVLMNAPDETVANDYFTINSGIAEGILWGGNLSSLVSMCGINFVPEEDFILFVEDINEPIYKLDKMFTQLLNMNSFSKKLKGIIWGEFLGADKAEFSLMQEEFAKELKIPMCNFSGITHGGNKITLPYGVRVEFNADLGSIIFKEEYLI